VCSFQSLVGSNDQSWGWDLGRNKLYHDSKNNAGVTYPVSLKADQTFIVPDKFLGKLLVIIAGLHYNISVDNHWFYVSEQTEILITMFQTGGAV
jgi:hypothetical protein